ncbi:hypothetical protein Tco_1072136 [Tanacetum coccineum]
MSLWNRLLDFIANHNGQYVIFGEFNDVQDESERYVMDSSPDFKVIALPRGWSDHTPLLLLYENDEYGRVPFKLFHSWLQCDGFNDYIMNAYSECSQGLALDSSVDLPNVIPHVSLNTDDNSELEKIVTVDEIKMAVWDYDSQKDPGPDGFSFLFLKTYCDLLKDDIVEAMRHDFDSFTIPKGFNSSFITLILKVKGGFQPERQARCNDYLSRRGISFLDLGRISS